MDTAVRATNPADVPLTTGAEPISTSDTLVARNKNKSKEKDATATNKRRCVSTACVACRKRKSKCDGNLPKCAACASVYLTECEYAPHTDHRRKGVYKKDVDNFKTKNSTLQILVQALLNAEEDEDAFELVKQIRTCDSLEDLAQVIENKERGIMETPDSPVYGGEIVDIPRFEAELSSKMGDLFIDGSVKFVGGTSNLIWLKDSTDMTGHSPAAEGDISVTPREEAILSWTTVTEDKDLILHFINMYFCWHYAYFTTLSKELFYRDFLTGNSSQYCSPLLVNVMLALGCHFSTKAAARADPEDSSTTGNHFFSEAKRLLHEDDEFSVPKLCTVQALALMSVREAGCGRESKGWVYSGMSFRLASDLGLNIEAESINDLHRFSDDEIDARRITFWGCFLFDKCWSNYLGRQPLFLLTNTNVKKPDVFGSEDSEMWSPYTDSGIIHTHTQPARTRAVSLQIFKLAEISSDLLNSFYQPQQADKLPSKQGELKKLSDIHTRLEAWRKDLPPEMEAKDGQLPQVLLMHMFYQLLYIHLYRPFLKYTKSTSPLPTHVSPRKFCTQAASAISKLFRLYKRTHGLRQICNIAVYIAHSACTIHLLNLPDKNAKRDIVHGMKQLEEIGDCWVCARRTLRILGLCADKWKIELPEEARAVLQRTADRWAESAASPPPSSPATIASSAQQAQLQSLQEDTFLPQSIRQHSRSESTYDPHNTASSLTPEQMSSIARDLINRANHNPIMQMATGPESAHAQNRPKVSLHLTQAQQDAWNAHQARMGLLTPSRNSTPFESSVNASILFGGVDSLIEDSQDWWYNDQSQIAHGFDNWNTPSTADWSHVAANDHAVSMSDTTSTVHMPSPQGSAQYINTSPIHNNVSHMMPPASMAMNGYPLNAAQQHLQSLHQPQRHVQVDGVTSNAHQPVQNQTQKMARYKRRSSFDDNDILY